MVSTVRGIAVWGIPTYLGDLGWADRMGGLGTGGLAIVVGSLLGARPPETPLTGNRGV